MKTVIVNMHKQRMLKKIARLDRAKPQEKRYLRIGDIVLWRGDFGMAEPKESVITDMEITEEPRAKYGKSVKVVRWEYVKENRVLFHFDNRHWAYSDQIVEPQTINEI